MRRVFLISLLLMVALLSAARYSNLPITQELPDGSNINLFVSGDEFVNYLHDKDGYTIIRGEKDGYLYYAELKNDEVVPSIYQVGSIDPNTTSLDKGVKPSSEAYKAIRKERERYYRDNSRISNVGDINNLVVFIRFADQTEFDNPRTFFDNKFNNDEAGAYSMKNYFLEASYNQMDITSHYYPVSEMNTNLSYQDSHNRNYFRPYNAVTNPEGYQNNSQKTNREHQLIADCINAISSQIPSDLNIDSDNDGKVDNMCFIIRGSSDGWADLLWAHRWVLFSQDVYINGKRAYDFTFQPENQNDVTTLCHEMFHVIGAPDLYHYSQANDYSPAGAWDLMDGGAGQMLGYMKYQYGGWINEIPQISESGRYSLDPMSLDNDNIVKIYEPGNTSEYYVLEYRRKQTGTIEQHIPGSGLLVTRIRTSMEGEGNADGPPDEVYVMRPNGTSSSTGNLSAAHFNATSGRNRFNNESNPAAVWSNGDESGIFLNQISVAGDSITFFLNPESTTIAGSVTTDSGETVEGATIYFDDIEFDLIEGGAFAGNIYEGIYNVRVEIPGYKNINETVTLAPNTINELYYTLETLESPYSLNAVFNGNDLNLSWDFDGADSPEFEKFVVYRGFGGGFNPAGETTEQTFTIEGLPNIPVHVFVLAEYSNGISDSSNIVIATHTDNENVTITPEVSRLKNNYPNPFNPTTTINYDLARSQNVEIAIYNVKGQKINTLVKQNKSAGKHSVQWTGVDNNNKAVTSGVYFVRMISNDNRDTQKILLMK
jgi:M6 family metalloprotease-like protein